MKAERLKLLLVGSAAALAGFAAWHAVMWVVGLEWWARAAALGAWLLTMAVAGTALSEVRQ